MDRQEIRQGRRLDLSGSVYGQVTGSCVNGNEPSESIKFGDFLTICNVGF